MFDRIRRQLTLNRTIREAIDIYPDGLCFAATDGRPILVNKKLNALCAAQTGHALTNAEQMWKELQSRRLKDASAEVHDGFSASNPNSMQESFLLLMPDGSIWQFARQKLTLRDAPVIQYLATDVTELYHYRNRLRESNIQAERLHERQRELLRNIVQNNLDQEILAAKVSIHDEFGRLLLMSRNVIVDDDSAHEPDSLFAAWDVVVTDMGNVTSTRATSHTTPEGELVRVAEMIGCQLRFIGPQPSERKPRLLLYAAIREALTNAVRHAGASCLTIEIDEVGDSYHATIRDNGHGGSISIQEGSGLGNLRRRLEREGAQMDLDGSDGVTLALTIPKE